MRRQSELKAMLQELERLLVDEIEPGSAAELRFASLMAQAQELAREAAWPPAEDRLRSLGRRIEALARRRETAAHERDVSPGRDAMPPMIGWRFEKPETHRGR